MTQSAVKAEVENLSEVKRKLSIEVPADEVTEEVDRAYRELGKQAKVKGFRPGKVPRSVLEMYYHKQIDARGVRGPGAPLPERGPEGEGPGSRST